MSDENLTWWDRLCLRLGLCWDAPAPPAPVTAAPIQEPVPAEGVETVGCVVGRVMQNYNAAVLILGQDTAWMVDPAYFSREKEIRAALTGAAEPLAVIAEIPSQNPGAVEWHFLPASVFEKSFSQGIEFWFSGRDEIDATFFRLDGESLETHLVRRARDGNLPVFIVKKEGGGGAPPPARKRNR